MLFDSDPNSANSDRLDSRFHPPTFGGRPPDSRFMAQRTAKPARTHRLGLIAGRAWSFPPAFIDEVHKRDAGVTVEYVKIGAPSHDDPVPYDVIIDRISHEVPMYRSYLKHAVLAGSTVVNNPFMWTADDKFFGASLVS